MWKVFLVISSVVLLGALYLANENRKGKLETQAQVATQADTLAARSETLEKTETQIAELEQQIQMLQDQTETLETEKVDFDAKVVEAKSNLTAQEAQLVAAKEKLDGAKSLITDLQEIETLQKEMAQIRVQIEESEIELTQIEGAVVAAKVDQERFEKVAAELTALRKDQEAGVIRGEFQTTVKKAYNQWGFVIVNGGYDQGVVNRAQLDVYRRGQPICKLLITSVEPGESAADIIPGSLVAGQTVQIGDTVVKTIAASAPAVIPAAETDVPAGGAAAPADAGAGMGAGAPADPFGGAAPAPDTAPDPFGGAAPAPAADAAPDPFGGGGAMEEKPADPGAAPDPFQ
ncbi:MAG: hypothetical protein P1U87_13650 [Verrucomicrobiales bacterium]|nr:hypothetical protein [Verrucomicrobiales bacterium]